MEVRALVSMASGLYPLARAEALSGLAAVLKKVNAGGGVVECCYGCAVKLLKDEDEGIRLAAVRLVGLCVEKFAMREELGGDGDQMDRIFLQVRAVACKTLGALAKLSNQYAQKALDLLMDIMNDDTEAVRLQTLHTLFGMATYGSLSVQEKHMHMFLGIMMDANVIVRNAARKILGSVNLPKLQMFKSALDGLIAGLEKNPEDQDIYAVLFSIDKNHGSFFSQYS